ncbi:VanZ like family protein [Algibacter pectinivorans]|uniref:VanZ like family protein n=1 Tax=Algibacter pectinivorans TaxID=870482 RepID=A0A1I1MYZ2_9FLAO|nr:VanZ like family protein [Algibacter pectinivorans]
MVLKKATFIIALVYALALAVVSLINLDGRLPDLEISFGDKIFHFLAYALFAVLWYFAWCFTFNFKKKKALIYAFIFAVLFGIIMEVLQGTFTASRALDVYDALANTLGALIAASVLWFKNQLHIKN